MKNKILVRYNDEDIVITFSAGVAQFPDHGSDEQSLLNAADSAVYTAKDNGRCRVEKYQAK